MKAFEWLTIRPRSLIIAACYACVLLLMYYPALRELGFQWSGEDYSYCWFIPFISLYLIWEKRAALAGSPAAGRWQGLAPFLLGIFLFWLGQLGGEYTTLYLSLWFVLIGLVWLHAGRQKMRSMAFAFLVLPAAFPLPNYVNTRLTVHAKMISSELGAWILNVIGIPAYRAGNVIDLGFTKLQVVDACSGLRYILPLMLLGLLLAYRFRARMWKRAALFLLSIPLSILMNSFRIALTGILYGAIGPEAAEGFFHGFSGWLIFMAALPVFFAAMLILKKMPPKDFGDGKAPVSGGKGRADGIVKAGVSGKGAGEAKAFLQPQFTVALMALLLTFGLSQGIEFRHKVPIEKPFSQFPSQVGQWKGTRETMERQFREALNFSDYIIEDFTNPQGKTVNLYVAYYQDQRKGESIHSPETCFPMNGWKFEETGTTYVYLDGGKPLFPVNRAFIEKEGTRELSYFWFPQRGRILTKLYQLKIFTFWDSLTEHRTDGALVRLVTPLYSNEKLQNADGRLQAFTREIVPVLDEYIPGRNLK